MNGRQTSENREAKKRDEWVSINYVVDIYKEEEGVKINVQNMRECVREEGICSREMCIYTKNRAMDAK